MLVRMPHSATVTTVLVGASLDASTVCAYLTAALSLQKFIGGPVSSTRLKNYYRCVGLGVSRDNTPLDKFNF